MSYDISFRIEIESKIDGRKIYIPIGTENYSACLFNLNWEAKDMLKASTGLDWENKNNFGLAKDIIPYIELGLYRLNTYPEDYKKYEGKNGWGTVKNCIIFFSEIIQNWKNFCMDCEYYYEAPELTDMTIFWVEKD